MTRYHLTTAAVCLAVLLTASVVLDAWSPAPEAGTTLKVGFLYENDESAPYTYDFFLAQSDLERIYGDRIEILSRNDVLPSEAEEPLRDLARKGCRIIFTNIRSTQVVEAAADWPGTEFCQVSFQEDGPDRAPDNYHTFNGKIWQGRYVCGVAAGMLLRERIDRGELRPEEALVGFVAGDVDAPTLSAAASFLLGIRSEAPEAVLRIGRTGAWSDFSKERACARRLIAEGCVVLAQHTATTGPAAACEEARQEGRLVSYVGTGQSMSDIAPTAALISCRVDWTPYVRGAVEAVLEARPIERVVDGTAHGHDMTGGFEEGWIELLDLDRASAVPGMEERARQTADALRRGRLEVFRGDYRGVDPEDPRDTCDLRRGYEENVSSSLPSFHYVLEGAETIADWSP